MSSKQIIFDEEVRKKILRGVDTLADAVKITLGPRGRNVIIQRPGFGHPSITKDGVSVAKEIHLEDPFENMGAQMVREVASKTSDIAGDGTTSSVVLAQKIYREGAKLVAAGHSPLEIKRGIDAAVQVMVAKLDEISTPIRGRKEVAQIGTISANADSEIGDIIASAMDQVGREGVITIDEASGTQTSLTVVEGLQFERGYLSPYFVTNPDKMEAQLNNPLLILTDRKISHMREILPIVEKLAKLGRPFVLIADDVDGEALGTLVVNHVKGALKCAAVRIPGFGDRKKAALEDLAVLTGGVVVSEETGVTFESLTPEQLGQAGQVEIGRDLITIVDGAGDKTKIEERVKQIKGEIERTNSDYDREKLQERLAKLIGGVAVIRVGAATESEMREKKARVEDALHSTRAAVEGGIVPGGGVALLRAQAALDTLQLSPAEMVGVSIIRAAAEEPLRQIVENAGGEPSVVVNRVREGEGGFGFNALTETYEDLQAAGVIDPTKVTKTALIHAASIAGLLLTTGVMIADKKEDKKDATN